MTGKALPGIPAAGTAPGAAPVYEIKNLLFSFGRDPVLSIQQLDFEKAKIHVLLGPNGSGKTTLLKILNRLLTGWSGSISFQGSPIAGSEDVRLKTVYLHQSPLLFTGSVYDNVSLGLRMRKLPAAEIREKVAATLGIVGLKDFGKRKALALSGGEAQRVALARALALDPEVLLLDEPTAGVDKHHTGRIENLLRVIKGETGTTIIISTHNLPFAYRVCDRLVHLEEGGTRPLFENILPGTMEQETSYFTLFNSGGILLKCPLSEGTFTRAVLDYDRILLSLKPVETSAQNCLPC
ncbi:MAG: ATP-binding cassette domain-containing protein, partial [Spirochaetales bacterium]